jgi:hypothetical protein
LRELEWTSDAGLKTKTGQKRKEKREIREKLLNFLKANQTNVFKYKFEFKHTKAMHQHVCNIKLL